MGFTEAISMCYSKYATFNGRASRSEYWYFALYNFLLAIPVLVIFVALVRSYGPGAFVIVGVLIAVIGLINLLPGISVCVRRLHDTGRSGWWYWIGLIPYIGVLVLFIFMLLSGDKGDNEYGPDPLLTSGRQSPRNPQQSSCQSQRGQSRRPQPSQSRPQAAYDYSAPHGGAASASRFASEETVMPSGASSVPGGTACLVLNGMRYALRNGRNIIGRQGDTSEATVQIATNDMYMSRQHCVITVTQHGDGRVRAKISNYQNKNKTMINDMLLGSMQEMWLPDSCDITMGRTTMRYIS